jgi:hypothetical protein
MGSETYIKFGAVLIFILLASESFRIYFNRKRGGDKNGNDGNLIQRF